MIWTWFKHRGWVYFQGDELYRSKGLGSFEEELFPTVGLNLKIIQCPKERLPAVAEAILRGSEAAIKKIKGLNHA